MLTKLTAMICFLFAANVYAGGAGVTCYAPEVDETKARAFAHLEIKSLEESGFQQFLATGTSYACRDGFTMGFKNSNGTVILLDALYNESNKLTVKTESFNSCSEIMWQHTNRWDAYLIRPECEKNEFGGSEGR